MCACPTVSRNVEVRVPRCGLPVAVTSVAMGAQLSNVTLGQQRERYASFLHWQSIFTVFLSVTNERQVSRRQPAVRHMPSYFFLTPTLMSRFQTNAWTSYSRPPRRQRTSTSIRTTASHSKTPWHELAYVYFDS